MGIKNSPYINMATDDEVLINAVIAERYGKPLTKRKIDGYRLKFLTTIKKLDELHTLGSALNDSFSQNSEFKNFLESMKKWEKGYLKTLLDAYKKLSRSPLYQFVSEELLRLSANSAKTKTKTKTTQKQQTAQIYQTLLNKIRRKNVTLNDEQIFILEKKIYNIVERWGSDPDSADYKIMKALKHAVNRKSDKVSLPLPYKGTSPRS